MSTLYAVVWIMAFQVIIATSHDRLKSFGEGKNPFFEVLLGFYRLICSTHILLGVC